MYICTMICTYDIKQKNQKLLYLQNVHKYVYIYTVNNFYGNKKATGHSYLYDQFHILFQIFILPSTYLPDSQSFNVSIIMFVR